MDRHDRDDCSLDWIGIDTVHFNGTFKFCFTFLLKCKRKSLKEEKNYASV